MKPPTRIFDPAFRYVPSWATDIHKTFKRASRHESGQNNQGQDHTNQWVELLFILAISS